MNDNNLQDRYLFRGKRLCNNEWVIGDLSMPNNVTPFILPRSLVDCDFVISEHRIDINTIGQSTGLHDKDGVLIFEGDIITDGNIKYIIKYSETASGFLADEISPEGLLRSLWHLVMEHNEGLKVVGNIYDNPELLEVNAHCKSSMLDRTEQEPIEYPSLLNYERGNPYGL